MKIKNYLLHIGLLIAVIVSLVFSAIIWIDPATFHRNTETTTTNGSSANSTNNYDWTDVYAPTKILWTDDKKQYQLTSTQTGVFDYLRDDLKRLQVAAISVTTASDFNHYRNAFLDKKGLMLTYAGPVSLGLFGKMISNQALLNQYANYQFNHIVIPMNDTHTIYLFNDSNLKIYKVKLVHKISRKIFKIISNHQVQQTPIQYIEVNKHTYICDYPQGVTVAQNSYLISKENANLFITRLLGTANSDSITSEEINGVTVYTTANGQRLAVNEKTGVVNYTRDDRMQRSSSFNKILKNAFSHLNNLGVALDNVRYQGFNTAKHQVIYKSYVNGYPIISANYNGTYEITMRPNGEQQYLFSMNTLQVLLPNNNQQTNLPPTSQVIKMLKNDGYNLDKVQNIIIGYEWSQNPGSQMVVNLTPTYFIHYDNRWINYQNLKNH